MTECDWAADFVAVAVEAARGASSPLLVRGAVHRGGSTSAFAGTGAPPDPDELLDAARHAEGRVLVAWNAEALHVWNRLLRATGIPGSYRDYILLVDLVRRTLPGVPKSASPEDVAAALQLPPPDSEQPASLARFIGHSFVALLELTPAEYRTDPRTLKLWLGEAEPPVDFGRFGFGRDWLARLPVTSGVYVMRTREGSVIYVGKAANVRRRVLSYFNRTALHSAKNRKLHEQLHSVDVLPVDSEIEALLTEMRLIRRYRPAINIQSGVHDGTKGFGRERNLVLLVPGAGALKATCYFLSQGAFAGKLQVRLGRPAPARLRRRIADVFFGGGKPASRPKAWERELVFRWLAHNRGKLNFVDVDDAGTCGETLRQISDYLLDPGRLVVKVWHR